MGTQTVTEPVAGSETKLAPLYRVLIHNDDITSMEFVVHVLTQIFKKEFEAAKLIMLEAHIKQIALVDVMGFEEAEFRVDQAHSLARGVKYPLTFTIEPE